MAPIRKLSITPCVMISGWLASSCICSCPEAGSAASVTTAPSDDSSGATTASLPGCSGDLVPAADGLIDNLEDADSQVAPEGGRDGYWWSALDDNGSVIENKEDFVPVEGGPEGSTLARRAYGTTAGGSDAWGINFGATFVNDSSTYDASKYAGISFMAKVGEDSTKKVRFKVGDVNTHKDGGVCTTCWNHFGKDLTLSTEWKEYRVTFAELKQAPGWGDPRPPAITPDKLVNIDWSIGGGGPFDIWVDDVRFLECK